ncbi:LysE family transporter [Halobaculum gomorrense]|uniref:LysE type translocator n=1 Tax=Halobaculum gomorrense TaxID=43928 RepID=A0A1M5Q4B3_9EURY|nr:LysE family transporter [Halobaculum gomorrense]SHH08343.1 LysE type translocator [Halobaculum gomorrense]
MLTRRFASRAAGVGVACGVAVGVLVHATAAALGLAAIYRAVPAAATLVTLAGFRRGLVTSVANPKVALFFLAFLPGFAGGGQPATMAAPGAVYALLTVAYLAAVGALAGRIDAVATGRVAGAIRLGSAAALVALAAALIARVA